MKKVETPRPFQVTMRPTTLQKEALNHLGVRL